MVLPLPDFSASRLLFTVASAASEHVHPLRSDAPGDSVLVRRAPEEKHDAKFIAFACFIPILVLLSGLFSGLTLGYMSLDETQLKVLSISGTPQQKKYAAKIQPIRKNGHLLLVTLLLGNMIVNETLPVISDPILGGGVQSVVVSTILIVIFAEIIPQSLCTRYGLYYGAKLAGFVRVLILLLGVVAWPVSKLLEYALGPHHGIIYRRAELKELIAMHSNGAELGGDLKTDTVTIIGAALDLQEKVVKQAMTPIKDVFMLSIDAKLDYETLRKICLTGHSRIPVYEEVEIPVPKLVARVNISEADLDHTSGPRLSLDGRTQQTQKVKKIIGILLVKQCVLLHPNDATPVRNIPLNKVPFVPNNEPLLGILDKFQEGRSHMAIVSRFSVQRATSVKQAVKRGLTRRLRDRVLMSDSDASSSSDQEEVEASHRKKRSKKLKRSSSDNDETLKDNGSADDELPQSGGSIGKRKGYDVEMGVIEANEHASRKRGVTLPKASGSGRWEQSMPADAVLTKEGVEEFLQSVDPAIMPLGIITLEDVLEELIGEEIYDEFDPQGHPDLTSYVQPETKVAPSLKRVGSAPHLLTSDGIPVAVPVPKPPVASSALKPMALSSLKNLNFRVSSFQRSKSTPPMPRDIAGAPEKEKNVGDGPPHPVTQGIVAPHAIRVTDNANQSSAVTMLGEKQPQMILTDESLHPVSNLVAGIPGLVAVPAVSIVHPDAHRPIPSPAPAVSMLREHALATASDANIGRTRSPFAGAAGGVASIPVAPTLLGPGSRSTSPAPSLEQAILVERKRRAASASGSQYSVKGGWFKSSPLNGEERHGIIVAERVKRDVQVDSAGGSAKDSGGAAAAGVVSDSSGVADAGDVRKPDEKDKAGPDKEWYE